MEDCTGQTLQPSFEAFLDAHGFSNMRKEYRVPGDVLYVYVNRDYDDFQCPQP